jgi:hypothetical protein
LKLERAHALLLAVLDERGILSESSLAESERDLLVQGIPGVQVGENASLGRHPSRRWNGHSRMSSEGEEDVSDP